MRIRKPFQLTTAVTVAASLGLVAPALASPAVRTAAGHRIARGAHSSPGLGTITPQTTTTFAGYRVAQIATGLTVRAAFTVPHLKCTKVDRAILVSVGMLAGTYTNFSAAELFLGCSAGKPTFFPKLTINGSRSNFKKSKAHPGDKIVLKATENANQTVVTAEDTTTKVKKTLTGVGASRAKLGSFDGNVGLPWVGDQASFNSSNQELGVPEFGKISFSGAKVAGQPLGSFASKVSRLGPELVAFNRTDPTNPTLQIKTGTIASNMESFKTIFKHS